MSLSPAQSERRTVEKKAWIQHSADYHILGYIISLDEASKMAEQGRVLEFEMGEDMDIPVETKYPWDVLAEGVGKKNFFLRPFASKAAAQQKKSAVYSSGSNYYRSREMDLVPKVMIHKIREDEWHLQVWAKAVEAGDEE